jgi:signal transduction histidine kinase
MSNLLRVFRDLFSREIALAVAFVILASGEILLRGVEPRTPLLIMAGLLPLPLIWRIRFPLEVLVVSVGMLIVGELVAHRDDYPVALGCVAVIAAYSAAAHLRDRQAEAADFLVIAAIVGSAVVAASKNWNGSVATNLLAALISLTILFRGAWSTGRWMQRRRDRAHTAIVEREQHAQAALRAERARIARELHDVVAHAMSVIVLQTRGARHALRERPGEAREALDAVERTATHALSEMRRLLGALREEGEAGGLAPQPSLEHIGALLDDVRGAGLPVELRVTGARRELSPGIDLCAYRIVQEALTNTLRHAGPATAHVLLRYGEDEIEVEVADTGAGALNGGVPGQGLAGMRERVALFGGQFHAGPREGGYVVAARLPL